MANKLIWDFESFQSIHSRIWDAADRLDECRQELRTICREAEDVLSSNGPVSRRILDNMESLLRRTANFSLRAQDLADASAEANFKMRQSERELERGLDDLEQGDLGIRIPSACGALQNIPNFKDVLENILQQGFPPRTCPPQIPPSWELPPLRLPIEIRHDYCIPAWLTEAINSVYGTK